MLVFAERVSVVARVELVGCLDDLSMFPRCWSKSSDLFFFPSCCGTLSLPDESRSAAIGRFSQGVLIAQISFRTGRTSTRVFGLDGIKLRKAGISSSSFFVG